MCVRRQLFFPLNDIPTYNEYMTPQTVGPFEQPSQQRKEQLRPWVMLTSMAALFCLASEVVVLEHIDSLSRYLTCSEITVVAGIVFVILLSATFAYWLCVLLLVQITSFIPALRRHRPALAWYLGVGAGFCCLIIGIFGAVKLLLLPQWDLSVLSRLLILTGLLALCAVPLLRVGVYRLQRFGLHVLLPIFLIHFAVAAVTLVLLLGDGTHFFHDYAHPGRSTAEQLPDIYLITLDALNAEDTSLYGYGRPTTPNLQRFAERSFTFDYFFANCNFTTPATTSIETGKLPWSHRVFQFNGFLRSEAEHENLATLLRQRGYYTAMISSNYPATPILHRTLASYDAVEYVPPQGLEGYWLRLANLVGTKRQYVLNAALPNRLGFARAIFDALVWPHRYPYPPEPVFDRARSLLERSDIKQPRFLWAHIFPPHDPYLPPPPYRNRFSPANVVISYRDFLGRQDYMQLPRGVSPSELRARYDEMVLYADDVVGHFLDWLDQTGRLDHAIVIVTADHGESFEQGWFFHGGPNLDNDLIHIPLLIHLPGQQKPAHVTQLAQQADLLPTLIDLIGGEVPSWTNGTSLKPALEGKPLSTRFIFSMNLEGSSIFEPISSGTLAILNDEFKYVRWLGPEPQHNALYRYKTDASDEHDLVQSEPEVAKNLDEALLNKLKEINQRPLPSK